MSKDREPNVESSFTTRRAALGMTAAMTAGLLAEKALSPDSAHAEGVSSVNGKTGAVELPGLTSEGDLLPSVVMGNHHWDASDNIAIGSTLSALTVGSGNTSLGVAANNAVTSGENNVAIGKGALAANTTHRDNIAIGNGALEKATVEYSIAIGAGALKESNPSAALEANIAIGTSTLEACTTGYANTAVGQNALLLNKTGSENTAIGIASMEKATGEQNTAVGANSAAHMETGKANTAVGIQALLDGGSAEGCVAVGMFAMNGSTAISATYDTAVGYGSLGEVSSGGFNSALGANTLAKNTTGYGNVAIGYYALYANKKGASSVAVGTEALIAQTEAEKNVAVGVLAGAAVTAEGFNTFIGSEAGKACTGGGNVCLGNAAGAKAVGVFNELFIANNSTTSWVRGAESGKKIGFCGVTPVTPPTLVAASATAKEIVEALIKLGLAVA